MVIQINSLPWEVSLHASQFAQDLQEARTPSPHSSFPFFGTPTDQLQFVEGQLASVATGGLERPAEEELFREYIGLAETLRESIRLGEQDSNVAEEVQASELPIPSSPCQPIPTQWFLQQITDSPDLAEISRAQFEDEELWRRVGGPEAEFILTAVQHDLISRVVERAQTEELGGDPNDFDLSVAPHHHPHEDKLRREPALPYLPAPPAYIPAPPTYKDNRLCPDFLGLAEGIKETRQEEEPLKYMEPTGEIAEDPITSSTVISSESSISDSISEGDH
ncbi:uncharacterized protein FIBRA_09350 [Fibroporia radiculosa]|uniref:Uncharacterized protein n=1 Tax=Fibroporia radiculosa TaxID=599839 RepID=J7SCB4_9APHY|nr:uncharacterized protein FIBRA_09350 [Fibroporia radiculosa]CCM07031.1 predicted protein [Fibroporia radiculosa]